ncbi:MAG: class I SAM-dependent rRNA methyltransferase [Anaerolineae bacterium]
MTVGPTSQSTGVHLHDRPVVRLRPGKERPVRQRHPWVFSGAIRQVEGSPAPGALVEVEDAGGRWLARGYFNSRSQISVRILTWDPDEVVDGAFWQRRLAASAGARAGLAMDPATSAYRLAYAESDCLPGLVVDRYAAGGGEDVWLVVQFLTAGVEMRRAEILDALEALFAPLGIVDRSDVDVRRHEGLPFHSDSCRLPDRSRSSM